jgi:hypothetical protein
MKAAIAAKAALDHVERPEQEADRSRAPQADRQHRLEHDVGDGGEGPVALQHQFAGSYTAM